MTANLLTTSYSKSFGQMSSFFNVSKAKSFKDKSQKSPLEYCFKNFKEVVFSGSGNTVRFYFSQGLILEIG